jgi:hypothetical protein
MPVLSCSDQQVAGACAQPTRQARARLQGHEQGSSRQRLSQQHTNQDVQVGNCADVK